jgi:hypothetical protein
MRLFFSFSRSRWRGATADIYGNEAEMLPVGICVPSLVVVPQSLVVGVAAGVGSGMQGKIMG